MSEALQEIPGVGRSLSADLEDLGYSSVAELRDENPEDMYRRLIALRGQHIDRCVLYVFRCAVYYAGKPVGTHDPQLLKWWKWKDREHC